MIDDPIARDFSAVRTPVLSLLIQHELFRIKIAAKLGVPVKVGRGYGCDHEKRKLTMRTKMHTEWRKRFKEVGWRAGTTQLAGSAGRSTMSVHSTMRKLEADGVVVRDGSIPHPGNGRDQTIWKWVGNAKA